MLAGKVDQETGETGYAEEDEMTRDERDTERWEMFEKADSYYQCEICGQIDDKSNPGLMDGWK